MNDLDPGTVPGNELRHGVDPRFIVIQYMHIFRDTYVTYQIFHLSILNGRVTCLVSSVYQSCIFLPSLTRCTYWYLFIIPSRFHSIFPSTNFVWFYPILRFLIFIFFKLLPSLLFFCFLVFSLSITSHLISSQLIL